MSNTQQKNNNPLTKLWASISDCYFSEKRCLACHAPFTPKNFGLQKFLCPDCIPYIKLKKEPVCVLCGHQIPNDHKTPLCLECINNPPPWDKLKHYGQYDELLKALILNYKFSVNFSLVPLFAECLYQVCANLPPCDLIIPMPRHEQRLVSEGFNHVLELCKPLSKQLNIPLQHKALIRTRYTPPQSSLTAKERKNNPKKSFQASMVENKNILLIDDLITTGSTLRHATLALHEQGAQNVYIAVIARVEI